MGDERYSVYGLSLTNYPPFRNITPAVTRNPCAIVPSLDSYVSRRHLTGLCQVGPVQHSRQTREWLQVLTSCRDIYVCDRD